MRFTLKLLIFIGLKIKEFSTSEPVCILGSFISMLLALCAGVFALVFTIVFICGYVAHFFISVETAKWFYKDFKEWDLNAYMTVGSPICISIVGLLIIAIIIYTCIQNRNNIVQFFKNNWSKADEISKKILKEK